MLGRCGLPGPFPAVKRTTPDPSYAEWWMPILIRPLASSLRGLLENAIAAVLVKVLHEMVELSAGRRGKKHNVQESEKV